MINLDLGVTTCLISDEKFIDQKIEIKKQKYVKLVVQPRRKLADLHESKIIIVANFISINLILGLCAMFCVHVSARFINSSKQDPV